MYLSEEITSDCLNLLKWSKRTIYQNMVAQKISTVSYSIQTLIHQAAKRTRVDRKSNGK